MTGNPNETLLIRSRAELEAARAGRIGDVAVVMTMGALHDGHLALVRAARRRAKTVVVTVFVNPLQFGPNEDFARYPRSLEADLKLCEQAEADLVFAPPVEEVYPGGEPLVRIAPGPMGELLEGAHRPGHFAGMLTVVNKLINLTAPDYAFFGEKDAQQLALIRRMALDLNLPVEIVGVPTVREPDGLALSSRNRYLSAEGRRAPRRSAARCSPAPRGPRRRRSGPPPTRCSTRPPAPSRRSSSTTSRWSIPPTSQRSATRTEDRPCWPWRRRWARPG